MNFIVNSSTKINVGDRGYIIGDRFVPVIPFETDKLKEVDTVFLINAEKHKFKEVINELEPSYNNSEIINGEFIFQGEKGKYFQYNVSNISSINFGTNKDFTIETVARMTKSPNNDWVVPFVNSSDWYVDGCFMIQFNRNGKRFSIHWNGYGEYNFDQYHDNLFNGELFHLAFTRNEEKVYGFVNGIKEFTGNSSANANFSLTGTLWIGCNKVDNSYIWNGNIKWLRISNTCKYTENFDVTELMTV